MSAARFTSTPRPMAHTPVSTSAIDPSAVSLPVSGLARAGALVLGLFVLAGGVLFSLGTVLPAPIGMWVAARLRRRRGRVLGRGASWMVAAGTTAFVLAVLAALAVYVAPPGSLRHARATMDSANAVASSAPPPTWLQRLAPNARPGRTGRLPSSPGLQMGFMIWGMGFGILMMASILGTLGWAAGMLFGFAGTGRWLGATGVPEGAAAVR